MATQGQGILEPVAGYIHDLEADNHTLRKRLTTAHADVGLLTKENNLMRKLLARLVNKLADGGTPTRVLLARVREVLTGEPRHP